MCISFSLTLWHFQHPQGIIGWSWWKEKYTFRGLTSTSVWHSVHLGLDATQCCSNSVSFLELNLLSTILPAGHKQQTVSLFLWRTKTSSVFTKTHVSFQFRADIIGKHKHSLSSVSLPVCSPLLALFKFTPSSPSSSSSSSSSSAHRDGEMGLFRKIAVMVSYCRSSPSPEKKSTF